MFTFLVLKDFDFLILEEKNKHQILENVFTLVFSDLTLINCANQALVLLKQILEDCVFIQHLFSIGYSHLNLS